MEKCTDPRYQYNKNGLHEHRVGQAILDIVSKKQTRQTVDDTMIEFGPDYVREFETCVNNGSKHYANPFYVLVMSKKVMWAVNLLRNYFIARQTMPFATDMIKEYPNATKTLYKVNHDKGQVDIIWSLPSHNDCLSIASNPSVWPEELVQWIFMAYGGKFDIEIPIHKR